MTTAPAGGLDAMDEFMRSVAIVACHYQATEAKSRMVSYGMAAMHGAAFAHISDYWREKVPPC